MGAYRLEIGQSVRTKINTTTLPGAARNGSNGLPARSMAKPCEFVETTKAVHNTTIATRKRENNRTGWRLLPMGSQPGMEKCYCACERLSIWLSGEGAGWRGRASSSTNATVQAQCRACERHRELNPFGPPQSSASLRALGLDPGPAPWCSSCAFAIHWRRRTHLC